MKLFKHSNGMIIAFGFDMVRRCQNPHMLSWSDTDGTTWEPQTSNLAGWCTPGFGIDPEFVFETSHGVVGYQPGRCIEMTFIGAPLVWSVGSLMPSFPQQQAA